ncbi:hypothetical protein ACWFPY_32320 [Nocardia fluminea]
MTQLRSMAPAVFVPSAVYGVGTGAAAPMLPLRALELGASVGTAGVVVAVMGFGLILGDLPAGRLAISAVTVLGVAAGALAVAGLGGAAAMYRWFPGRPVGAVTMPPTESPKETREPVESN